MRLRQAFSLWLVVLMGCNNPSAKHPPRDMDTVRYRLLIRENPVSPGDAAHCFVGCQSTTTPKAYIECLQECPGFEKTPGEYCRSDEVPPQTACLTVKRIPAKSEPPPGYVVLAIIGEIALIVAAVSLCNAASKPCGVYQYPPPIR